MRSQNFRHRIIAKLDAMTKVQRLLLVVSISLLSSGLVGGFVFSETVYTCSYDQSRERNYLGSGKTVVTGTWRECSKRAYDEINRPRKLTYIPMIPRQSWSSARKETNYNFWILAFGAVGGIIVWLGYYLARWINKGG